LGYQKIWWRNGQRLTKRKYGVNLGSPGINALLRKLKKEYILVVLSDTIDSKQEKIEKMKIVGVDHRVFDEIFTSHDLGACKPSKKVFWVVLKNFRQTKRSTFHK
jgi:FMN phosphatase YigB (HAD superfamily)